MTLVHVLIRTQWTEDDTNNTGPTGFEVAGVYSSRSKVVEAYPNLTWTMHSHMAGHSGDWMSAEVSATRESYYTLPRTLDEEGL